MAERPPVDLDEEWEADARLIAAAPELLALLKGIRRHLAEAAEREQDFDWLIAHACVQGDIDPLIRRIEGEQRGATEADKSLP